MENKFAKDMRTYLRQHNALLLPLVANEFAGLGYPDLLILHRDYKGFVEWKDRETKLEPHQKQMIQKIKEKGFPAFVVRAPNRIENEYGELLAIFEKDTLLEWLYELSS